jgi:hypothetical protein
MQLPEGMSANRRLILEKGAVLTNIFRSLIWMRLDFQHRRMRSFRLGEIADCIKANVFIHVAPLNPNG